MSQSMAAEVCIRVLCFAQLKDRVGQEEVTFSLPMAATGKDVLARLRERWPAAGALLDVSRLAVNREFVSDQVQLQHGDEVAIIPPVSGG